MRVFYLCVYNFLIFWFLWVLLALMLLSLGRLRASFSNPLGCLGLARDSPWRHFGFPLAPLGLHAAMWGTLGSRGELGVQNGRPMPSKWLSSSARAQKVTRRISAAYAAYGRKVAQKPQLPINPTSLAPGARMTVF